MPSYDQVDDRTNDLVNDVMVKYHGDLTKLCISFDALFAYGRRDSNGIQVGPAIKHKGYPALATVKVTGLKERAKGFGDFELIIDGDQFRDWNDEEKVALIDHELQHLQVVEDANGEPKLDDCDRVRLAIRPHDHEIGWFDAVARRHKKKAWEYRSLLAMRETLQQLKLPF